MRQLFLDEQLVTMKAGNNITFIRENPYFTKSSSYTMDIICPLTDSANVSIFGILNRHDVKAYARTFSARLEFDNRSIYGEAHITKIDDFSVTIQILAGNALLNNNVGSWYIDELNLGTCSSPSLYPSSGVSTDAVFFPIVNSTTGVVMNQKHIIVDNPSAPFNGYLDWVSARGNYSRAIQPYLNVVIKKIVSAIGYNLTVNELDSTIFKNLFIANSSYTIEFAKALPHWTVNDFFTEIENFAGVIIISSEKQKSISILFKSTYYNSNAVTLLDVVDEFDTDLTDAENDDEAKNISYDLSDDSKEKYEKFSEDILKNSIIINADSYSEALQKFSDFGTSAFSYIINVKGKHYIQIVNSQGGYSRVEYNSFRDLVRSNSDDKIDLKITPVMFELDIMDVIYGRSYKEVGKSKPVLIMTSQGNSIIPPIQPIRTVGSPPPTEEPDTFNIYEQLEEESITEENSLDNMRLAFWDNVTMPSLPYQVDFDNGTFAIDYLPFTFPFTVPKFLYYNLGTPCNSESLGRTWSMELNHVDGRQTLGDIAHLSQISFNENIIYTKRFITNEFLSVEKKFVINNKRFVCKKITMELDDDGMVPYQEGEFYMMND